MSAAASEKTLATQAVIFQRANYGGKAAAAHSGRSTSFVWPVFDCTPETE